MGANHGTFDETQIVAGRVGGGTPCTVSTAAFEETHRNKLVHEYESQQPRQHIPHPTSTDHAARIRRQIFEKISYSNHSRHVLRCLVCNATMLGTGAHVAIQLSAGPGRLLGVASTGVGNGPVIPPRSQQRHSDKNDNPLL